MPSPEAGTDHRVNLLLGKNDTAATANTEREKKQNKKKTSQNRRPESTFELIPLVTAQ